MIRQTLIEGLNDKMVQARLNSADASQFYFGKHFPVKKVTGFTWKTLSNQLAAKNVAADCIQTMEQPFVSVDQSLRVQREIFLSSLFHVK